VTEVTGQHGKPCEGIAKRMPGGRLGRFVAPRMPDRTPDSRQADPRSWWWAAGALGLAGVMTMLLLTLAPAEVERPAPTPSVPPTPAVAGTATDSVEGFVASFRVAIEAEDVDFLIEHLHPVVVSIYGAEACLAFIQREVLRLQEYELAGTPTGPVTRTFTTPDPDGSVSLQTFEVPVSFDYQGTHYQELALLGLEGGIMHWFAECD